jgi:hypothetical protein
MFRNGRLSLKRSNLEMLVCAQRREREFEPDEDSLSLFNFSIDDDKVLAGPFSGAQSFAVGPLMNVQFMAKDSKKSAATGGWDFKGGKPGDKALHETCFSCHAPANDRDFAFARYAPWRSREEFEAHASGRRARG